MRTIIKDNMVIINCDEKRTSKVKTRIFFLDEGGRPLRDDVFIVSRNYPLVIEIPDGARFMAISRGISWNGRLITIYDLENGKRLPDIETNRLRQKRDIKNAILDYKKKG